MRLTKKRQAERENGKIREREVKKNAICARKLKTNPSCVCFVLLNAFVSTVHSYCHTCHCPFQAITVRLPEYANLGLSGEVNFRFES